MSQAANYFSPDYVTARTRFRQAVTQAGGRLYAIPLDAKGPANEELTIDVGWIGSDHPKKVLLHSSGLHGVEGFAGSAIQLELLDNLLKLPDDAAFVFVHVLNPYGMAWLRRFNENNVDLNRNFLQGEEYAGVPEKYPELDSFLNPPSPPSWDLFLARAGWIILRNGFNPVKQAIAGGQYEYPRGLFFGGKQLQQGPEKYHSFLAQRLSMAEQVVAIDVHTGLGKYGEDILLVENTHYTILREKVGDRVAPLAPDKSAAYRVRGGMNEILPTALASAKSYFVAQEFGTYGPLKVLRALREENRWHHFGGGALDHPTKEKLKEAFYPNDDAWRLRVLKRGRELFNQATILLLSETDRPEVSTEAEAIHKQGREAGGRGDYKRAIALFERASNLAPEWAYPVYDMAYTYLLMKDFDNARVYYRKTVELSPRGFFTSITALDALEREAKGDLPSGTYMAYVSLEWITDTKKKAAAARQLAQTVPGFAPVWKDIAYLADTDTERLAAIEHGLAAHPDPETKGVLLTNKALALDRQGDHDLAVRLLQELLLDPHLTSGTEHMTKVTLASLTRK